MARPLNSVTKINLKTQIELCRALVPPSHYETNKKTKNHSQSQQHASLQEPEQKYKKELFLKPSKFH